MGMELVEADGGGAELQRSGLVACLARSIAWG
jgi:hypothetical protein